MYMDDGMLNVKQNTVPTGFPIMLKPIKLSGDIMVIPTAKGT